MSNFKYSIILPYYSRPEIQYSLVYAYHHYNHRDDIEIIIVEDSKNYRDKKLHEELLSYTDKWDHFHIRIIQDEVESYNSATKYNLGVFNALSDLIVLSNPEVVHIDNILEEADKHDFTNTYLIFDCAAVNMLVNNIGGLTPAFVQWYEHETIRRQYHFCSVISKSNFWRVGGFNEALIHGLAFEDDFFIARVRQAKLDIINSDLVTAHVEHPRTYGMSETEKRRIFDINHKLWSEACRKGDLT